MTRNALQCGCVSSAPWWLVQGLACLGSLSLLNSGASVAQSTASELAIDASAITSEAVIAPEMPVFTPPDASSPSENILPAVTLPEVEGPAVSQSVAPETYTAPAEVILTERSTGCETSVAAGQAVGSICAPAPSLANGSLDDGWTTGMASVSPAGGLAWSSVMAPGGSLASVRAFYQRTVLPPDRKSVV